MSIIKENWKAIESIEQKVRDKTDDPEAGFNASSFWIGERKLAIPCMHRKPKGDGFTKKYYEMMVTAKYCPFTGKPLYEDIED